MDHKTIFLGIDGTLTDTRPTELTDDQGRLLPCVPEGLRLFHAHGYDLVVVTNHVTLDRGWLSREGLTYTEIHLRLRLATLNIPLAAFYHCPHRSTGDDIRACMCRIPKPGLLMQAACELKVDLPSSWLISGWLRDVEAGRRAGCRTILLTNGHESDWEMTSMRWPDLLADNLLEAAHLILLWDRSVNGDPAGLMEPDQNSREHYGGFEGGSASGSL